MTNEDQYMEKLDKLLKNNPEMKDVYDMVSTMLTNDNDEEDEMEFMIIDGKDYLIFKEFVIKGTTYVHLVSEDDPLDTMYRKIFVKDGKEYMSKLDSEQEFDLVVAYEQKYIWRDIKRKQEMMSDDDKK